MQAAGAIGGHRVQVARLWPFVLRKSVGDRGADLRGALRGGERDHAAAEAAADHAGPGGPGADGGVDGLVGLWPGHPELVAERTVRFGEQRAYRRLVTGAEQVGGPQDAAVLGDDVPA